VYVWFLVVLPGQAVTYWTSLILYAAHMATFFIRQEVPWQVYVMGEASISGQSCVRWYQLSVLRTMPPNV
jgi:hypothetical protein